MESYFKKKIYKELVATFKKIDTYEHVYQEIMLK